MRNLLKSIGKIAADVIENQEVIIPITPDMLLIIFRKNINKSEKDTIHNLDVSFREEQLCISGLTKKLLMPIQFEICLKPSQAQDRVLYFNVIGMKPLNQG